MRSLHTANRESIRESPRAQQWRTKTTKNKKYNKNKTKQNICSDLRPRDISVSARILDQEERWPGHWLGLVSYPQIYLDFVHKVAVFQESEAPYTSAFQAPVCIICWGPADHSASNRQPRVNVGGAAQRHGYQEVCASSGAFNVMVLPCNVQCNMPSACS